MKLKTVTKLWTENVVRLGFRVCLVVWCAGVGMVSAQDSGVQLALVLTEDGSGIVVGVANPETLNSGTRLVLERSVDLEVWTPLVAGLEPASVETDSGVLYIDRDVQPTAFYRLVIDGRVVTTASAGEEVFGFTKTFQEALAAAGQLSVESFQERYAPEVEPREGISFLATDSEFWDQFSAATNAKAPTGGHEDRQRRSLSLQLNEEELALFEKNGMVVSGRLGSHSFTDFYYGVFHRDLPVFVTADSVLHAWHKSYSQMLSEMEDAFLSPRLSNLLRELHLALPDLANELPSSVLEQSLHDADYYLAVARSLYAGTEVAAKLDRSSDKVKATLEAIGTSGLSTLELFGRKEPELVDFSQFVPRGYYANSPARSRYFQMVMWCGRVDLRVAGPEKFASPRELGTAIILNALLDRAEQRSAWEEIDRILRVFVGVSDSMGFDQLDQLLEVAGKRDPASITDIDDLIALQETIEDGELGTQAILSHGFYASRKEESLVLPRSFTVFGQKFVMDSWALGQVVFDKVFWDGKRVPRRLPSGLDVAFTVMGNEHAARYLSRRLVDTSGVPFRDGYPIQHHLTATHEVFDGMPREAWGDNIYTSWLWAMRQLSEVSGPPDRSGPEVFQTSAWADRLLVAQLGSWTQLRHDTVLYAKQSASPALLCSFPHTYVEPSVPFWEAMATMAETAGEQLRSVASNTRVTIARPFNRTQRVSLSQVVTPPAQHMERFAGVMRRLHEIAIVQRDQGDLSTEQSRFLQDMVEIMVDYVGARLYAGWYPRLFYMAQHAAVEADFGAVHPADDWDALVTDVHTDFPDERHGDPGTILLEGVGNVAAMLVAVDCDGEGARTYAGPVFTHYEFTSGAGIFERPTDADWKKRVKANDVPELPEWTHSYFAPGHITIPDWLEPNPFF